MQQTRKKSKWTINEAIKLSNQVAKEWKGTPLGIKHEQYAAWLRELVVLRRIVGDEMKLMIKRKNRKQNDIK